jgi:hypothetical protein
MGWPEFWGWYKVWSRQKVEPKSFALKVEKGFTEVPLPHSLSLSLSMHPSIHHPSLLPSLPLLSLSSLSLISASVCVFLSCIISVFFFSLLSFSSLSPLSLSLSVFLTISSMRIDTEAFEDICTLLMSFAPLPPLSAGNSYTCYPKKQGKGAARPRKYAHA